MTSVETSRWLWFVAPASTLTTALLGSVLCWLAFPPVAWGLLAWVAPIPWLTLILLPQLPGKRPYRSLWLAGTAFWLLAVHWIRLPHPLNHLALLALAGYLGIYLPLFVGLSRVASHQLGAPLWLAAPIVWTGLDWLRGRLMTGFLMASLAHTQVKYPVLIQIADLFGEYGVTFLVLLVPAAITQTIKSCLNTSSNASPSLTSRALLHNLPAIAVLTFAIFYGIQQSKESNSTKTAQAGMRIALIQGHTLADWKSDPAKQEQIVSEYLELSHEAVQRSLKKDGRQVDLVIWPETTFRQPLVDLAEGYHPPETQVHSSYLTAAQTQLTELTKQLGSAVLVGIDRWYIFQDETGQPDYHTFNSSVLVDASGKILGTYDKMHRVPFGEFIPLAKLIPALYRLTPLTGGIEAGEYPAALRLGDSLISPNICYETAVPHLIGRQVRHVVEMEYAFPAALINLTNDAWYWGSSELDMHLACGVFRAVEMRTPLLIAANGGLSAHIDSRGHLLQVTKRQQTETMLVDLPPPKGQDKHFSGDEYPSFYAKRGDWFAGTCVLCCIVLGAIGRVARRAKVKLDTP
ncbi:MAG: apolipoprotein N-acyltransferase [Planctomycetales bacterium]|nr:apolipoprotein N-acyltransferase [Planctomycetales bacterium]